MMGLRELFALIRLDEPAPEVTAEGRRFHEWQKAAGSPELAAWNTLLQEQAVRGGYRGTLSPASCPTLGEALAVPSDGCRAARIRSVFCGVSSVLEDAEELWMATWAGTSDGQSVVFGSHQDEREIWPVAPSLAEFLLVQYAEDPYFTKDLAVPPDVAALPTRPGGAVLPSSWDPLKLTERVHWIVALFFPEGDWYGIGDGLVATPSFSSFEAEEPTIAETPHLLAYWLLHHRVFDNRAALDRLRPLGEGSPYPAARELASLDDNALPSWWTGSRGGADRILELRAKALRERPEVFDPEKLAAEASVREARGARRARLVERLEASAPTAARQLALVLLEGAKLDSIDAEVIRDMRPEGDPDAADLELDAMLLSKRGDAPGLGPLFEQVVEDADASFKETAEELGSLVLGGDTSAELRVLTILLTRKSSWRETLEHAADLGATTGRLERAALAAVAMVSGDEAIPWAREEARRFLTTLHERTTDTTALATIALLRRRDPKTLATLTDELTEHPPHGVAGRALVRLMGAEPHFGSALEALVARDFGRPAEGEPVGIAAAFARASPERARRELIHDVTQPPARQAAILAGALVAAPENESLRESARGLLDALNPKNEREAGAALALLRALHEAQIDGFAEAAAHWRSAKISKHVGASLRRWFEGNAENVR